MTDYFIGFQTDAFPIRFPVQAGSPLDAVTRFVGHEMPTWFAEIAGQQTHMAQVIEVETGLLVGVFEVCPLDEPA